MSSGQSPITTRASTTASTVAPRSTSSRSVTGNCQGTTSSGATVVGRFDGTADVEAGTCDAVLTVEIAGATVVEEPGVDCFDQP